MTLAELHFSASNVLGGGGTTTNSLDSVVLDLSTSGRNWQVVLGCVRSNTGFSLPLFFFYFDDNVAHFVAAKQTNGDLRFHIGSDLAAKARVASLWGPPHHPDPYTGFLFPCLLSGLVEGVPGLSPPCCSIPGLRKALDRSCSPPTTRKAAVPSALRPDVCSPCLRSPRTLAAPWLILWLSPTPFCPHLDFTEEPSRGQAAWHTGQWGCVCGRGVRVLTV